MRFHLHLVSDSTGDTVHGIARACVAQFEECEAIEHPWSLVRSRIQLEKVLLEVPGLGDPLHLLGQIALARGQAQRAVELISQAIDDLPEGFAEPYLNLGNAYAALGQPRQAIANYRQAIASWLPFRWPASSTARSRQRGR